MSVLPTPSRMESWAGVWRQEERVAGRKRKAILVALLDGLQTGVRSKHGESFQPG